MQKPPETLEAAHARIAELERQLNAERSGGQRDDESSVHFRELAENIREVVWMTDHTGNHLVYICPAYEQVWGQSAAALYDDPSQRLAQVHEEDRSRVLETFEREACSGRYDEVYRIRRPDAQIRWIRDQAFPVPDDAGNIYRLAGLALDITDQVESADRISDLHDVIDERDRMSVFAALGTGLAHEIGQPLTAARNHIARVRLGQDTIDEDYRQALSDADGEIERAAAVVRHMREFAREGRPTLKDQPLGPIIADVHELMDPALRARDICYRGPEPGPLLDMKLPLDDIFVKQILRNLISNAVEAFEAADDGARRVRVEVERRGEHIDIDVADNGSGVGEQIDPFDSFSTTKEDGLGLGLAVSRTLARSHGGDLYIEPESECISEGAPLTRFRLRLPIEAQSPSA